MKLFGAEVRFLINISVVVTALSGSEKSTRVQLQMEYIKYDLLWFNINIVEHSS